MRDITHHKIAAAAAAIIALSSVPVAGCSTLTSPSVSSTVATVQIDTRRAQTIARVTQKVADDTLVRLHASGILTGATFNGLKAKAASAGKLLDTADGLIAQGNAVLGNADITAALASLADVQAATAKLEPAQ